MQDHLVTPREMTGSEWFSLPTSLTSPADPIHARTVPWRLIAGSIVLDAGTGSSRPFYEPIVGSGNQLVVYGCSPTRNTENVAVAAAPPEMLSDVQQGLSLSVTDLALALRVRRPTVYAWMYGKASPRKKNLERLTVVHRVARHWMKLESAPLGAGLRQVFDDGCSILSLLRLSEIPLKGLKDRLGMLADISRPPSLRERLRRRGIPVPGGRVGAEHVSLVTGQRIEQE